MLRLVSICRVLVHICGKTAKQSFFSSTGKLWNVGKDAFLASTGEVVKDTKSQGLGKALFSGEDLFIYKLTGQGIAWLTSYGAIETKHVSGTLTFPDRAQLIKYLIIASIGRTAHS